MNRLLVSAAFAGLISSAPVFAQTGPASAPAQANADAIIVQPIAVTLVEGTSLNFGSIAATAGTVEVDPDTGSPTAVPGMITNDTAIDKADFLVTGVSGLLYTPSLAAPSINIMRVGGSETMSVNLALSTEPAAGWTVGTSNFSVGGTLNVSDNQVPGSYTGTFSVTVQYD